MRAVTSLQRSSIARLREHCQSQPDNPVYEDIELFIFTRS